MGTGLHPTRRGGLSPHHSASGPAGAAREHSPFPSRFAWLRGSAGTCAGPGPTPHGDRRAACHVGRGEQGHTGLGAQLHTRS